MCLKARGQLVQIATLFLPFGFFGLILGLKALPAKWSCYPQTHDIYLRGIYKIDACFLNNG